MCEEEIQVRDSAEYPPVKVCEKNPRYAMAMLSNIGACNSEMSAVSLYFYNSLIANGKYEEIGNAPHEYLWAAGAETWGRPKALEC